ncbi:S-layer protein [archaeon]|nr:MAG: S-layer protein [archaeon]
MKILFLTLGAVLLIGVIAFGQSTTTPTCGSSDNPCALACDQTLTNQQTAGQIYYNIYPNGPAGPLASGSVVNIIMTPTSAVDYDLYTKTPTPPTLTDYSCRPYLGTGQEESCKETYTTYGPYAMVNHYSGTGTFNISSQCTSGTAVATTLGNYPNFLRSDSSYNVLVVVGSQATAEEKEAGTTIANSLGLPSSSMKLDTEVTDTDKVENNLILIGTPCINRLVNDISDFHKFRYSCDNWPSKNFGIIEVIDDAFATYKAAIVVAGTTVNDQTLASLVLQSYSRRLSGFNVKAVEITGTSVDNAVISSILPQPNAIYKINGVTYSVRLTAVARSGPANVAVVKINGATYNLYENTPVLVSSFPDALAVASHITPIGSSGDGLANIMIGPALPLSTVD